MPAHIVESRRQRTLPRGSGKGVVGYSKESAGGPPQPSGVAEFVRALRQAIYGRLVRYPHTVFDRLILRDRHPTVYRAYYRPPGDNWINWSTQAPVRSTLHMRQATWRMWVGNSASRFPYDPDSPTGGMHSTPAQAGPRMQQRYASVPQARRPRINRLSPAQYHGQTYSQQTGLQGGGSR